MPDPLSKLRYECTAVALKFTWFGQRRALNSEQKAAAARIFGADADFISASKKLFDTTHPVYRDLISVKRRARDYWRSRTLPYVEPGVRFIRRDRIEEFDEVMKSFSEELLDASQRFEDRRSDILAASARKQGVLYDDSVYPVTFIGAFSLRHEYVNLEPPLHLKELRPDIYEQALEWAKSKLQESVHLASDDLKLQFSEFVGHLADGLAGTKDGKPKTIRKEPVDKLIKFFDNFRELNLGGNEDFEQLVSQAQELVQGLSHKDLNRNLNLREDVSAGLTRIQSELDKMMVDKPRRSLLRGGLVLSGAA